MIERPDRYTMAWQIALVSNYSDEYLLSLKDEDLKRLYAEKVEHGENRK